MTIRNKLISLLGGHTQATVDYLRSDRERALDQRNEARSAAKYNGYTAQQWGEATVNAAHYASTISGVAFGDSCSRTVHAAVDALNQQAEAARTELTRAQNAIGSLANTLGNSIGAAANLGLEDVLTSDLLEAPGALVATENGPAVKLDDYQAIGLSAVNIIGALGDNLRGVRDELEAKALQIAAYRAVLDQVGVDPDSVEVVVVDGSDHDVSRVADSYRAQGFGVATVTR